MDGIYGKSLWIPAFAGMTVGWPAGMVAGQERRPTSFRP